MESDYNRKSSVLLQGRERGRYVIQKRYDEQEEKTAGYVCVCLSVDDLVFGLWLS